MKKSRDGFFIIEILLGITAAFCLFVLIRGRIDPDVKRISVIVEDSEDASWTALRYGLKEAASDYGVTVSFVSTSEFESYEDEVRIYDQEISDGTDAIIVWPKSIPTDSNESVNPFSEEVPTLLIGSHNADLAVVMPDNYAMGQAIADEMLRDYGGSLTDKTIGVLLKDNSDSASLWSYQGLVDELDGSGYRLKWIFGQDDASTTESKLQDTANKADIIVALDNTNLEIVGAMSSAGNLRNAMVYGIGQSSSVIYYLDNDAIRAVIFPDYFMMGYVSVEQAVNRTSFPYQEFETDTESVTFKSLRKDDLYLDENVDIFHQLGG